MKIKVKNIISKIAAVGVMILMVFSAMPNVAFAADSATALETVKALGITTGENLGASVTSLFRHLYIKTRSERIPQTHFIRT